MNKTLPLLVIVLVLAAAVYAQELPPPPPDLPSPPLELEAGLPSPPPIPSPPLVSPTAAPSVEIPTYIIISLILVVLIGVIADYSENRRLWK
ncbi:MAG: hypothetical protein HYW25_00690 [Candidatus Aenigmarchaeota archaeon]|nr:hypothetical protein [Candidatus Aenigmarchaeota archaeon]